MRLATFNINGRSPGENRVDPDRLANSIRTLAPDILALQEVDLSLPRSHDADLAAIVAEAMQCVDHRFVAALAGTPGAGWVEVGEAPITGPAFGNALFSRYPVRSWEVLRMPGAGPHVTLPLPGPRRCRHRRRTQSGADRRHRDATWGRAGGEHSPVVPARLQSRSAEAGDQMRGAGQAPGPDHG